jgi:uncharacterized glyoxalase superfamily protein PhnB
MKKLYPLLITEKLNECEQFYTDIFGFKTVFKQDWYIQLVQEQTGTELAFMIPKAENQPKELHPAFSGKGIVYSFEVNDATQEYDRLSKKNIDMIVPLTDEEWGQRHFIVRDPAGVYVDVVQQLKDSAYYTQVFYCS